MRLPLAQQEQNKPVEVALWSGGLDSLAGLLNRTATDSIGSRYVLFGTGGNSYIHSVQRRVFNSVKQQTSSGLSLIQLPFRLSGTNGLPKNRYCRSRGFVFLLLGAVCSELQGQDHLYLYENGIGAINLPFRSSEVGVDHTRAVHPTSLLKLGACVSQIFGKPFVFCNPFLFWTKAQMCQILKGNKCAIIAETITCDRRHRQKYFQCGWCSSCLLRRQALAVAGIQDPTRYVVPHSRPAKAAEHAYFLAMQQQYEGFDRLFASPAPCSDFMRSFTGLLDFTEPLAKQVGKPEHELQEQILRLYQRYTQEWKQIDAVECFFKTAGTVAGEAQIGPLFSPVQGVFSYATEHSRIH